MITEAKAMTRRELALEATWAIEVLASLIREEVGPQGEGNRYNREILRRELSNRIADLNGAVMSILDDTALEEPNNLDEPAPKDLFERVLGRIATMQEAA